MKLFDLKSIANELGSERSKVIMDQENYKVRMISLKSEEGIPACQMALNVIFHVLEGRVEITVDGSSSILSEGLCLITEPAEISMRSLEDSTILGIQIATST